MTATSLWAMDSWIVSSVGMPIPEQRIVAINSSHIWLLNPGSPYVTRAHPWDLSPVDSLHLPKSGVVDLAPLNDTLMLLLTYDRLWTWDPYRDLLLDSLPMPLGGSSFTLASGRYFVLVHSGVDTLYEVQPTGVIAGATALTTPHPDASFILVRSPGIEIYLVDDGLYLLSVPGGLLLDSLTSVRTVTATFTGERLVSFDEGGVYSDRALFYNVNHAPQVDSVRFHQRHDGSDSVDVTYALTDADHDPCEVKLDAILPGDSLVRATAVRGDIGSVLPMPTGRIVWYAAADLPGRELSDAVLRVSADDRRCPTGMIYLPSGSFDRGTESIPESSPLTRIAVDGFCLDLAEVSNAEYLAYISASGAPAPAYWVDDSYPPGTADFPVVAIDATEAAAYAAWRGMRLPTEAEWEYAARGPSGNRRFPWGSTFACPQANLLPCGLGATVRRGGFPADVTYKGFLDLGGNVAEWTASGFASYRGNPSPFDYADSLSVIRGGAFDWLPDSAETWRRHGRVRTVRFPNVGFRCAK